MTNTYGYIQYDSAEMAAVSSLRPKAHQIADYFTSVDYTEHQGRMINECGACMKTYPYQRLVTATKALPCRHRHCPICQRWRSEHSQNRLRQFMNEVVSSQNTAHWLVLNLSGQRSLLNSLRPRIEHMENAFRQMTTGRVAQHILGCIRLLEIDQSVEDDRTALPRFRCLLLVTQSLYDGSDFISQAQWAQQWKKRLHVRDTPVVHLRRIESNAEAANESVQHEISKSFNHPNNLPPKAWFLEMTRQLHGIAKIDVSGVLWPWFSGPLEDQARDLLWEQRYSVPVSTWKASHGMSDNLQWLTHRRNLGS